MLVLAPGGPASFRGLFAGVEEEQPMVVIQIIVGVVGVSGCFDAAVATGAGRFRY